MINSKQFMETDKDLGIPKGPHIPRPLTDILNFPKSPEFAEDNWKKDFCEATGNQNLIAIEQTAVVDSLKKAKKEINNALKHLQIPNTKVCKNEQNQQKRVLFDIPFPIPDTTIDKSVDNMKETKEKEMDEWSREKLDYIETIDMNLCEINQKDQLIQEQKREVEETRRLFEKNERERTWMQFELNFHRRESEVRSRIIRKMKDFKKEIPKEYIEGVIEKGDALYIGEIRDEVEEGIGRLEINSKKKDCFYLGEFKKGKFDGMGIKKEEKRIYCGEFKEGKEEGKGMEKLFKIAKETNDIRPQKLFKMVEETKEVSEVYEGEWLEGHREGKGKCFYFDGSVYEGDWKNGLYSGRGKLETKDGEVYDGDWKEGLEDGEGVHTARDGERYEGNWKDGRRHGEGTYTHIEGWSYTGDWSNGKKEGKGKLSYQKSSYEGDWKDDCRHGRGEYVFNNGEKYSGEWKDNLSFGEGKYKFNDGATYEGNFERGWPKAKGVFTFPSGLKIERIWDEHLPEGYRVQLPWQKTMYR